RFMLLYRETTRLPEWFGRALRGGEPRQAVECPRGHWHVGGGGGRIMTSELVLLVGLQAAGKRSFYRGHFAGTHDLVSKDCFPNNRKPARRQRQLVEAALGAGRSVVVDNTNPTREERAELITLASSLGARIVGYYFESCLADCLERNRQRPGKARVP